LKYSDYELTKALRRSMLYIKRIIKDIQKKKSLTINDIFNDLTNKKNEILLSDLAKKVLKFESAIQ
jgi:hypothetical protein